MAMLPQYVNMVIHAIPFLEVVGVAPRPYPAIGGVVLGAEATVVPGAFSVNVLLAFHSERAAEIVGMASAEAAACRQGRSRTHPTHLFRDRC